MSLDQQKLDGLLAQLEMAQTKYPVSTIQIAILKARIWELQKKMESLNAP